MTTYLSSGAPICTRKKNPFVEKEGPRYSNRRRLYRWIKRLKGQVGLCAMLVFYLKDYTEDDLRNKTFKELGLSMSTIRDMLLILLPELDEEIKQYNGVGLTISMVSGRMANMRRENKLVNFSLGSEYPKHHPVLIPILEKVDELMRGKMLTPGLLSPLVTDH